MLFNLQLLVKKRMSGDERINAPPCVHIPDNRCFVSKSYSFGILAVAAVVCLFNLQNLFRRIPATEGLSLYMDRKQIQILGRWPL